MKCQMAAHEIFTYLDFNNMRAINFYLIFFLWVTFSFGSFAQNEAGSIAEKKDTIVSEKVIFSHSSASAYIMRLIEFEKLWKKNEDTLKLSLQRLIEHYHEPFDSARSRLNRFPYQSVELRPAVVVLKDTFPVRWLDKSVFIIDTIPLEKDPVTRQKTIIMKILDPLSVPYALMTPEKQDQIESLLQAKDTITEVFIDTAFLKSKKIQIYRLTGDGISPPLVAPGRDLAAKFLDDSARVVFSRSKRVLTGGKESPFYIVPSERMPDSLQAAVETLLLHTWQRDSIPMHLNDITGQKTPFWLTSGKEELHRYWVRNSNNDSITIWIGNPSKYDLTLILEEEINVERMEQKTAEDIPFTTAIPERMLAKLEALKEIPVFWNYGFTSSFSLNQNYLSNWSRGGESSLSTMVDMEGKADYTNKESKEKWTSGGRLRYGTVRTKEHGSRKNADFFELNSQYNRVLREKFDFSTVFYFKSQVAKGYKYPNDSVAVSKFLNPGTFTIGIGFEYKPDKKTSINISPLSYKNTFVLDTAMIDQTLHGIDRDKRTRQEMGGQLVVKNSLSILDGLEIKNAVRLFSGYLDKPKNVDVDWEMNLEKQISWYFKIRLNLHLIYDDDIRFPVLDAAGQPVILPGGGEKKVAKTQFNQFLGLTLSFRI